MKTHLTLAQRVHNAGLSQEVLFIILIWFVIAGKHLINTEIFSID